MKTTITERAKIPDLLWKLSPSQIWSVYVGKAHACCCGCSGTHYYASEHREVAGVDRGYPVEDGEVSDDKVLWVFAKLYQYADQVKPCEFTSQLLSVVVGHRMYIAYLPSTRVRS